MLNLVLTIILLGFGCVIIVSLLSIRAALLRLTFIAVCIYFIAHILQSWN